MKSRREVHTIEHYQTQRAARPWEAEGISRRTWYRRKKAWRRVWRLIFAQFLRLKAKAGWCACVREDFPTPGETVSLSWQEAQQNFVITAVE